LERSVDQRRSRSHCQWYRQQQVTAHRWSSYARAGKQEVPLTTQYGGSSFSVGGAAVATEVCAVCARKANRAAGCPRAWCVVEAEALGGAAEGSYEHEARR
jgi:hypothetical protein